MRMIEVQGGIPVIISNAEYNVLCKCTPGVYKKELTEREQLIAKALTSKGVVVRGKDDDGGIYYRYNRMNPGDYNG